jgi:ankyrin repeat protein
MVILKTIFFSLIVIVLTSCNSVSITYSKDAVKEMQKLKIDDHQKYFIGLVEGRNIDRIRLMLAAGFNPNFVTDECFPLQVAAEMGFYKEVEILVNNTASVNLADKNGRTALMFASRNNHVEIVKLLISKGANLNYYDNNGLTALIHASSSPCPFSIQNFEAVKALIDSGADVNKQTNTKSTALMYASKRGGACGRKIVSYLIKNGADVNLLEEDGYNALYDASTSLNIDILKILLMNGINPNVLGEFGNTGLFTEEIIANNKIEALQLLIQYGADINIIGYKGLTPLMKACDIEGGYDIVKFFIDNGAKVNYLNKQSNMTALDYALNYKIEEGAKKDRAENKKIITLLRKHGAKTAEELKAEKK